MTPAEIRALVVVSRVADIDALTGWKKRESIKLINASTKSLCGKCNNPVYVCGHTDKALMVLDASPKFICTRCVQELA